MTKCSTVDDALAIYKTYNMRHLAYARTMLADKFGNCVIIKWQEGKMVVSQAGQSFQVLGYGENIVKGKIKACKSRDFENMKKLLRAGNQSGNAETLYSLIYQPGKGKVYVFDVLKRKTSFWERLRGDLRVKKGFTLDLKEELKKGNHYYDLGNVTQQLKEKVQVDGGCLRATVFKKRHFKILGDYRFLSGKLLRIRLLNGEPVVYWHGVNYRPVKLYAASENLFFTRSFDFGVKTLRGRGHNNGGVTILWTNREGNRHREELVKIDPGPK